MKKIRNIRLSKEWIIYISITIAILLLNALAWSSKAFCDAYIAYVFPIWLNTYGRLTGLIPFSIGEWMIVAGILLVIIAVLLALICAIAAFIQKLSGRLRVWQVVKGLAKRFYHFFAWVLLIVCVVMTLNCTILYHASTFSEKYFGEETGQYSLEECIILYNYVTEQCNRLSMLVERDSEGRIIYTGSVDTEGNVVDMEDKAREVMQELGKTYPQLDGWYPRPKAMFFSDLMCQQYMCGYYFPFSLEANYNDVMYVTNKPGSMCHELAHLRGYIYEDEANFIEYLACVESDDILFQYSGYLSALAYLQNDLYRAMHSEPEVFAEAAAKVSPLEILPRVIEDDMFVEPSEWDRINGKALVDTETVDEISDTFTDTTLKLNGVSDGMVSYSRVVRLLLQYYQQAGYP